MLSAPQELQQLLLPNLVEQPTVVPATMATLTLILIIVKQIAAQFRKKQMQLI